MSMLRVVEPELLDSLAPDDPRAIRSRADLRRINRWMAAQSLLGHSLDTVLQAAALHDSAPVRLLELGAGDGTLLLRLAQRRARHWPQISLGLLDLQPVICQHTIAAYRTLGWQVEVIRADVFDWLAQAQVGIAVGAHAKPVILANLFVHHFDGLRLQSLLHGIADCAQAFVCLEPRRSPFALFGSRALGAIGCNDVTRHDAMISVRAGFRALELSAQWPNHDAWHLQERAAGLFGHRFHAVRKPGP